MRRQLSLVLTLVAWLLATGSQWDLVQTFAWGRMITTYAHSMPLLRAVEKTFAGDNLCSVCELVQGAKQQETDQVALAGAKAPEKLCVVHTVAQLVFASSVNLSIATILPQPGLVSAERATPPLPPPRSVA